ncbi:MFS transporter [Achromobacter sp. GG226]|uniref:MFS transporter n=1 Tax=Verticiella alkaliphila TaxID=2779529 RepID=UPI001C0D2313|nr:MFS transporter [Verticiella sp. GG226]MBU4609370.1 MFS transporter [Verticiella sp. GG226]
MSSISSPQAPATGSALPRSLVLLLATGAGLGVASLYYSQPMLALVGDDLQAGTGALGLVPMMTQLGYALGILLLAPLGDRYDRRQIILVKTAVLALALLASGLSPNLPALLVASLVIGLAATLAQDIVPAAATLAPAEHRGRIVGTVMTGLLLGILLSRVVSGALAGQTGWRAVFMAAAVMIALAGMAFWRGLPRFTPTTRLGYGALLASMVALWRQYPALRRAALAQGLLAVAFSAFWSTLAVMLHDDLHLGSAAAGAFGLAGAAGALAAPLSGRLADRRGTEIVVRLGAALTAASFAVLTLGSGLSAQGQILLIAGATVGFDLGMQAALIAHQTEVYSLDPAARSRLNAVLFTGMFVGMASGAALGSWVLEHAGWTGVAVLSTGSALAALLVRLARRA